MRVQLPYLPGCPNVDATRAAVREALAAERLDLAVEEIDVNAPDAPAWGACMTLRGRGSVRCSDVPVPDQRGPQRETPGPLL